MNKTFNNETCWENILIYILKKKTFWEHQIGKQAPYLESTRKKLCEEVIGLSKREGKKRKKKKKRKEKSQWLAKLFIDDQWFSGV